MSGLCGWISFDAVFDDAHRVMDQMVAGLGVSVDQRVFAKRSAVAGLADIYQDDGVLAAIDGHPIWHNKELRSQADMGGHAYALATGFARMGRDVLKNMSGVFALVLIHEQANEVLLAVDRMGIRPLAYAVLSDALVFGTTADSVRANPVVESNLSPQALFDYTFFGFVPSPLTIYREQRKLMPAQFTHYRNKAVETDRYWYPAFRESISQPLEDLEEELRDVLDGAVRSNLSNDATGAFLSGGLDSSTICGLLARHAESSACSFSIGFHAKGYDEIAYARAAVKKFGLSSHEYYVTEQDIVRLLPVLSHAFDEPFGNSSAIPAYHCARMARESGIEVLLAGDGGDELFAGNERYGKQALFEGYKAIPRALREIVLEPLLFGVPCGDRISLVRKARSYIRQANLPLPERIQAYNILCSTPVENIFHPELAGEIDPRHPFEIWEEIYRIPQTNCFVDRMMFLDWKHTLADCDLRKVTRMCEQAGVDVRYPMLDETVVALSMEIPGKIKMRGNRLRDFYKSAFQDFLPREILDKPKHGFGLPFAIWLTSSSELQTIAYDAINSLKARGLYRRDWLDWLVDRHINEHAAFYGASIWCMMMLELWLQERRL